MKKLIFLLTILLLFTSVSYSQFDDLIKKLPGVPDWTPGGSVTTSIKDAYPVVPWLGDFSEYSEPQSITDFNLAPGYYRAEIQTYCLHAGTYGPTDGDGYLIAPLLGNQADLISSILTRSENYPAIPQHDIQYLIWGIEAGAKFTDYPVDFQARVKPLLTAEEITKLSVDLSAAFEVVPSELKDVANMYGDMRKRLVDPSSNYQDVENIAIRQGIPAQLGPGSKLINPGNWSYMKDGFYIRTYPVSYPHSFIEIYKPANVSVIKDNKNRVTNMNLDGHSIEVIYNDEPGMDILKTSGNPDMPIWRFKQIIMKGPNAGEDMVIENEGWIVRGDGKPLKSSGSESNFYSITGDPTFGEYQGRIDAGNKAIKDFNQYQKERKMKQLKDKQNEYWEDYHTMEGLRVATNPLNKQGQVSWINKTLNMVKDWWNQSSDALAGGEGTKTNEKKKFDPTKHVSAPGNTAKQRLAMSNRKYSSQ